MSGFGLRITGSEQDAGKDKKTQVPHVVIHLAKERWGFARKERAVGVVGSTTWASVPACLRNSSGSKLGCKAV